MSPKAFSTSQYDDPTPHQHYQCQGCYSWVPIGHVCEAREVTAWMRWNSIRNALIITTVITACIIGIAWAWTGRADAHPPHPIAAPQSLLRAREACPNGASLVECRGALRRAYAAVEWQRHARWGAEAATSKDVVRDAIHWASQRTGVPAWQLTNIARCESHLFFLAHNGQYLGVWQLGQMHRSDPIFRIVPWQDPYAQAIHVARFIRRHGESQWQCTSSGGLRW